MDSNVQFRAINSSWLRPSWGRSTGARSSEQFGDLGEPIDLSGGSGAPPLTARIRRRHTKVALSAVRAHRGSKGSNPSPSSSESALWLRVRRKLTHLFWIDHCSDAVSGGVIGGSSFMIVRSRVSVSGSKLLWPAVVMK